MFSGIFSQNVNLRAHYWFGDFSGKNNFDVCFLRGFWEDARCGRVQSICIHEPIQDLMQLEAPIAIFKHHSKVFSQSYYLLMQHGSYLEIPVDEQPLIEDGFVQIYRGIGAAKEFNVYRMPEDTHLLEQYGEIYSYYFSDSTRSFISAHVNTVRCETSHLKSPTEVLYLEEFHGLERSIDLTKLQQITAQCYTLDKAIAQNKFGPAYVMFKTPVTNIQICTYFAGESEVKILSLDKLIPINATQCQFNSENIAINSDQ